jgi:hypothetical protein
MSVNAGRILVVDDEENVRNLIEGWSSFMNGSVSALYQPSGRALFVQPVASAPGVRPTGPTIYDHPSSNPQCHH